MDEWSFWREQLKGGTPDTGAKGEPKAGYYIAKEYVSIPGGAKRVLTDFPVAIWCQDGAWYARQDRLFRQITLMNIDEIDEMFAKVCRNAVTHDRYLEMVAKLKEFSA